MNNKKHNLFNFFETLKSDANFNTLKERIGNYAKININTKDGKKINIYSAELFYLLSSEDYKDEGFINAYAKGYHNGNEFIENKTQKALNGFFKSCPEKYIDELKVFYFDKAPNEILSYKQIAKSCPINFYIDNIEKIGFASGVINAIDLMNIENPSLFEKFYEATPQQTETVKNDEVKKELHNDYFKDNAFEIWERLFENFNIDKTKRTDLRFMYEIMKHNGQIHKTITVKNITDWINETYDFGIDKLQYTSIKSKSNENRMSIYKLIK